MAAITHHVTQSFARGCDLPFNPCPRIWAPLCERVGGAHVGATMGVLVGAKYSEAMVLTGTRIAQGWILECVGEPRSGYFEYNFFPDAALAVLRGHAADPAMMGVVD